MIFLAPDARTTGARFLLIWEEGVQMNRRKLDAPARHDLRDEIDLSEERWGPFA